MVKPGVISLRERDYKFPGTLVAGINPHTLVRQALRTHERDELEEKVRLRLEQVGRLFFNGSLKFLGVISRNSIPRFCFTPVHFILGG
jgi:hypothetical protein